MNERHSLARILQDSDGDRLPLGLTDLLQAITNDAIAQNRVNIIQFAPRKRKEAANGRPNAPKAA